MEDDEDGSHERVSRSNMALMKKALKDETATMECETDCAISIEPELEADLTVDSASDYSTFLTVTSPEVIGQLQPNPESGSEFVSAPAQGMKRPQPDASTLRHVRQRPLHSQVIDELELADSEIPFLLPSLDNVNSPSCSTRDTLELSDSEIPFLLPSLDNVNLPSCSTRDTERLSRDFGSINDHLVDALPVASTTSVSSPSKSSTPYDSPCRSVSPDGGPTYDNEHFGPDFFWNYCEDEVTGETEASALRGSVESLLLSDGGEEEEEETNESKPENTEEEVPLYNDAPITQWESLTAILSFVQSEHISGAGIGRLLSLIDLHLPKPNKFLKTNALLFKVLDSIDEPVHLHYFCGICYKIREGPRNLCDTCTDTSRSVLFFITFPLLQQIQTKFARPGFKDDLLYQHTRVKKHQNNIEDIYDAKLYKDAEKNFDPLCTNLTLMWNTDGLQVFNSNSYSLWPFYLSINELPPKKRQLSENLLIAGLWGSVMKPHPNLYLLPIYKELKTIEEGVDVQCHGEDRPMKVAAKLVCGTCDAPARAAFLNMKLHSGFYSCPYCLIRGEKPGASTVFPYQDPEDMVPRNLQNYEEHVRWAVEHKVILAKTSLQEDKSCGIKGPTVLSSMVPDLLSGVAIDAMHCVYLGVERQTLHLWSDKEFKDKPFSIFSRLKIVNERLSKLSPPHFLQRFPQSIDKLIYWKATELRSFMFNLSLTVLCDVLKTEYYNHHALFVKGVALLNSDSISEEDLVFARLLLHQYVSQFEVLYGSEHMTHNMHMLLHLQECVRNTGPLWATSCFQFEDINGRLSNLIHGTRHVGLQIYSNLSLICKLPVMVSDLKEGPCKEFCSSILKKREKLRITEKIAPGLYCVGVFKEDVPELSFIKNKLISLNQAAESSVVARFSRLFKDGILYVANCYKTTSRVSSFVKYVKNSMFMYGRIECFVRVSSNNVTQHFAVVSKLNVKELEFQGLEVSHILRHECGNGCCDNDRNFDLVHVTELLVVLFMVNVAGKEFLCQPVNCFELQ